MPQESLRSVVYRSFVTCDDPRGVVERKTIRRSKHIIPNQNLEEVKYRFPQDEELKNMSSFQIMEVSRGAEKLNQVVDSMSNSQAKFIAQDLLQGALRLQDSLLVLSELQQASKQNKKMPIVERGHSRLSSLPPSRDCYDKLREVIRESFARQNLLTGKETKGLCSDLPSTSSSRSSLICSHSSDSSSWSHHDKPRGPNLIAKLMGLDEAPSRRGNEEKKEKEKEKFSSLVHIDLLRPKKERREVEERMEFKGVLGRKNDVSLSRRSSAADDPPIVIMKPLRRRQNHSMDEEKQNIKSREVQVLGGPKKKLEKYTENKLGPKKAPVPRMQKKQSVVTKIDDVDDKPKIAPSTKKREEAKDTKDVGKKLSTFRTESRNESCIKRASIKSSIPNKNLGRKVKPKSKPSAASLVENVPSGVNIESNIQGSLVKGIAEETINPCYNNVSVSDNACESSEAISKDDVNGNEDANCVPSRFSDKSRDCKSRTTMRRQLLSSVSFLNHVEEELFDTGACVFLSDDTDKEVVDDSLLLDCAKELLSRKSLRCRNTRMGNPSSQMFLDDKSIQELVGEICDGIECLRNYSNSCGDDLEDSIYPKLERDLWGNEEVTGAWDLGWRRDGYTMGAMKEVVHEIEKLILSELVADLVVEFTEQL
ncbi:hypothetical protein ACS0TY_026901 [Phlomoides rotata]